MSLQLSPSLVHSIEIQYEKAMNVCPLKKQEVEAWIAGKGEDEAVCMKFLYAFMPLSDLTAYDVPVIASYVRATLAMYGSISYAKEVPEELFLSYVLSYRVNNENLDESRGWLFEEIGPRVQGKTMTEAALEVNYWCYEKATYIPTDNRTIGPSGMCRRAKGRCGEESTLAVSALRSVGIPARQCYVPRWAHCDDNHAWVEVWADGRWHYLGACEPEPVLDRGWFTAAASKAMLVHAKAYSHFLNGELPANQNPLYSLINSTETYGNCHRVYAAVTKNGKPLAGVPVSFQLINYSELFELYRETTDEQGRASFLTGKGDLYICVSAEGKYVGVRVDTRLQTEVALELEQGICPESSDAETEERFDLNPPEEIIPEAPSSDRKREHEARLRACEAIRENYENTFVQDSGISGAWDGYFKNSKGNYEQIRLFYEQPGYSREDKELLLDTLREKDFADCTSDVLMSFLKNAFPHKEKWPREVYQKYILAPRIANEMLADCRGKIVDILAEKGAVLGTAAEVWSYLQSSLTAVEEYGVGGWHADAAGCLRYGICGRPELPLLFVQTCRALGIPARLDPVTREPEAVFVQEEGVRFEMVRRSTDSQAKPCVRLTLCNRAGKPLEYMHHFTLGRWEDGDYRSLHYWGMTLEDKAELEVLPGSYRLITSMRQIDGGVSAYLKYFTVKEDRTLDVPLREDRTAEKLRYAKLPTGECQPICGSMPGGRTAVEALYQGRKTILIFAEPGKEPTEHLLQEILECRQEYKNEGYRLIIALPDMAGLKNETLLRVLQTDIDTVPVLCTDEAYLYALHEAFHVGDERLPFAAAVNENGEGLFAFANYNIRTAWTLMNIFRSDLR